ncbi:leukocyte surface antigen CD53 [Trichomycterus rosablanca]|uniref:leukocyte surface antigen CD53 n=1 Tax=Trichomycterus rosablanca TaxID=2290929 RepID=UPI002F358F2E
MSCLKCLKYTMCVVNFIFFICGAAIFGLGIYLSTTTKYVSLFPSLSAVNLASTLYIVGIFVTCISFLGFLGALRENRCLLISFFLLMFLLMLAELAVACTLLIYEEQIDTLVQKELSMSISKIHNHTSDETIGDFVTIQKTFQCCGVNNSSDWKREQLPDSCCPSPPCKNTTAWPGCFKKLKDWFEKNLLSTGIGVVSICCIEVLGMCFSMTLFCHISKSGLGYK